MPGESALPNVRSSILVLSRLGINIEVNKEELQTIIGELVKLKEELEAEDSEDNN